MENRRAARESKRAVGVGAISPAHNALSAPHALHPLVEDRSLCRDWYLLLLRDAAPAYRPRPWAIRPIGSDATRVARWTRGSAQRGSVSTDFRRAGGRKRGCLIWDARHFVRPAGREPPDSDPHRGGRGTDSVGLAPERAANPENCARSRNGASGGTSRWPRKGLARVRPLSHAPTRLLSCPGRPDGAISTGTPADSKARSRHGPRTPRAPRRWQTGRGTGAR